MSFLHRFLLVFSLILLALGYSFAKPSVSNKIKTGSWKAELFNQYHQSIPFLFDVVDSSGKSIIKIYNADETLIVDDIQYVNDSVKIVMPFFDSEFMVYVYPDSLVGRWTKIFANRKVSMPVKAYFNNANRFVVKNNVVNKNVEGTWDAYFMSEDFKDTSNAIGEFTVVGDKVYGTFLSTTGDYRYLEGKTDGNTIYLSTFDGSHAYLFVAEISADKKKLINGVFYSGWNSKEIWSATKNASAKLPDTDKLTFLKEGYSEINFKFKNLEGKEISLSDEYYKNKVVLVQIMGSWCPNCMDETNYLVPLYNVYKDKGLEIIGLCYERSEDFSVASKNVLNMKRRLNIPYQLLIPGANKKGFVNESLPMLQNFIAFPTLIVVDRNHKVRKIHTGYSGPATGKHYVEFKTEFESYIKKLLSEK